jgi:hypothetical protein
VVDETIGQELLDDLGIPLVEAALDQPLQLLGALIGELFTGHVPGSSPGPTGSPYRRSILLDARL